MMSKTGLSYPKAMTRIRKADDQLREAIGEDIEARLRELLARLTAPGLAPASIAAPAAAVVEHQLDVPVQLQERCGHRVVTGPSTVALIGVGLPGRRWPSGSTARLRRIVPTPIDNASRGTRAAPAAEQIGVRSARAGSAARGACRLSARARGSLKPMCPFAPMPRICRSMPPAARDGRLVATAFAGGVRGAMPLRK